MEIVFSREFRDEYRRIRDDATRMRILKQIRKLEKNPKAGKPLRGVLKNYRTLRVPPHRIIYRMEEGRVIINCFGHRNRMYR
jgi:mRNA-degrading endonuclease RelE of RelBE toxin-antitoxin system